MKAGARLSGPLSSLELILTAPGPSTRAVEDAGTQMRQERSLRLDAMNGGDRVYSTALAAAPSFMRGSYANITQGDINAEIRNRFRGKPLLTAHSTVDRNCLHRGIAAEALISREAAAHTASGSTPAHSIREANMPNAASNAASVQAQSAVYESRLTGLLREADLCKHEPPDLAEDGDAARYLEQLRTPQMASFIREIRRGQHGPLLDLADTAVRMNSTGDGCTQQRYMRIDANFKRLANALNSAVGAAQVRSARNFLADLRLAPEAVRSNALRDFAERLTRVEKQNRATVFHAILDETQNLPRQTQALIGKRLMEQVGFLPAEHRLTAYRSACAAAERMAIGADGGSALRLVDEKSDGPGYFAREGIYNELHRWFTGLAAPDRAAALQKLITSTASLPADRELPHVGTALEHVTALPSQAEQHDALVALKHRLDVHRVAAKFERPPTMAAAKSEWGYRVVRLPDAGETAEALKAVWDAKRDAAGI